MLLAFPVPYVHQCAPGIGIKEPVVLDITGYKKLSARMLRQFQQITPGPSAHGYPGDGPCGNLRMLNGRSPRRFFDLGQSLFPGFSHGPIANSAKSNIGPFAAIFHPIMSDFLVRMGFLEGLVGWTRVSAVMVIAPVTGTGLEG